MFTTKMYVVDYGSSFVKSTQFKEGGGDNQNPMEDIHDDIDTLVSNKKKYKLKGRTTISGCWY
jgi:hypothetical protein